MSKKLYYKIGEVAKMYGVKTSLLRYWEKEFDIIKPHKSRGGLRRYTQKDIDNFDIIYHLVKVKGMTIKGAKEYLKAKKENNEFDKLEVLNTLKRTKRFLKEIKEILDSRHNEIG